MPRPIARPPPPTAAAPATFTPAKVPSLRHDIAIHARPIALAVATLALGCSSTASLSHLSRAAPTPPGARIAPAPPPKDDGSPAQGGTGGSAHAAALEELKVAPLAMRGDKQASVRILLPDAPHWTRVKFWGVPSLVGFRYGKSHHAIVAAFITHVDDNTVTGACQKSFEDMASPFVQSFEVEIEYDAPQAAVWSGHIADIVSVIARTATLASRESYAATFGAYPAWKGACLIVGIAVPSRDEESRARDVRDRFAREVLPKIEVTSKEEPKERY